jgi:hypothetical protein
VNRVDDLLEAVVLRLPHRLRVRLSRALARGSQVVEPPACADWRCCFQHGTRTVTMKPCSPLHPDPALVRQLEGDEQTIRRYRRAAEGWPAGGNWEGDYLNSAGERWRHVPNVGWERR